MKQHDKKYLGELIHDVGAAFFMGGFLGLIFGGIAGWLTNERIGIFVGAVTMLVLLIEIRIDSRLDRYDSRHAATDYTEYPDDWDELRRHVYQRDAYQCANCSALGVEVHAHHIVPLSCGGTNNRTNLITLCRECHERLHPHMRN